MFRRSWWPERTVTPPPPAGSLLPWLLLGVTWTFLILAGGAALELISLSPATWYIARASGLVLFVLSWLVMMTGLALSTRLGDLWWPRHVVFSAHEWAFQLWIGFLVVHGTSIGMDPTVPIGSRELVVPFISGVREPWTGFGVLAALLTLVVGGSASLRRILPYGVWRATHWLAFPAFVLGLAHGLGSGTDSGQPPVLAMYFVAVVSLVFMACYRVLRGNARAADRRSRQPAVPPGHAGTTHAPARR